MFPFIKSENNCFEKALANSKILLMLSQKTIVQIIIQNLQYSLIIIPINLRILIDIQLF